MFCIVFSKLKVPWMQKTEVVFLDPFETVNCVVFSMYNSSLLASAALPLTRVVQGKSGATQAHWRSQLFGNHL